MQSTEPHQIWRAEQRRRWDHHGGAVDFNGTARGAHTPRARGKQVEGVQLIRYCWRLIVSTLYIHFVMGEDGRVELLDGVDVRKNQRSTGTGRNRGKGWTGYG